MEDVGRGSKLVKNLLDKLRQDVDWQLLQGAFHCQVFSLFYKLSKAWASSWHAVANQLKVVTDLFQCDCSQ